MTLYIEPEYVVSDSLDATHISYEMLEMTATHLFLASNRWDTAVIEVSDMIPKRSLRHINAVVQKITVKLPEVVNQAVVGHLSDLYPELGGKIRKAFLSGQDLREVLSVCITE